MTSSLPIEIDGSEQSGSGTLVRFAVAYAALLGRPLHLVRARARRSRPGLRPQHVAAIRAAAELCRGRTEGVEVGAGEFRFVPGPAVRGGTYAWDIGTAGSATMLALGLLPIACLADGPCLARITGGVFQDFAPSPHHLQHVLAPLVGRMGPRVELGLVRAGYLPRGAGVIELRVEPATAALAPLRLPTPGVARSVRGIAFSSHLEERRVSERMASACEERLAAAGLACTIERALDRSALHAGASLAVWTETSAGCLLGADRAGAPRRSSEAIGHFVAESLLADLRSGASADRHASDQLVPFAALAAGASTWTPPRETEHLTSNLWLAERFGARAALRGGRVEIEGLARRPGSAPSA
jgi:RNA 3'-terminal phosphate cyclase (ATP)